MIIRKATGDEMLALWGCKDINTASPTARFFYDNISAGNALFWALDSGAELIGELYVFLELEDRAFADGKNTAYLCAFRVKKEYRGQGHGRRLMTAALAELKERGFLRATIVVKSDEPLNIKLYRNMGFEAKIKDFFFDPCRMDENMQPAREDKGLCLLSKDLLEER